MNFRSAKKYINNLCIALHKLFMYSGVLQYDNFFLNCMLLLTSTLVPGINYFVVTTHPLYVRSCLETSGERGCVGHHTSYHRAISIKHQAISNKY